ncbi:MAG: methionine--tRNA ligase [Myxococcales bacterium]|nr:methionine--tRNA ligase [Myxococcales bacterium]
MAHASDEDYARILVTSALPYANGPAHLGHLAGAYLPGDIYCRFQRLMGRDVVYICGSDEHGVAIIMRAREEGVSPQEIVDRYHPMLRDGFEAFGMSFDHYGRTSSPKHHEMSQAFFAEIAAKNKFVLKKESQLYDPEAKLFLADRFVRGKCPNTSCGYEEAYGDQCEKCGRSMSPKELIDPRSAITDAKPELKETTHWYLPLDEVQGWLEQWLDGHGEWKPNVLGQAKSWLKEGLRERSMTRDLPWGVPVPSAVAEAAGVDAEGKVLYVWFDAPIGYISSTCEWAEAVGEPDRWRDYWGQEDTKLVHFIGKDNIVFHCLIFPAMLKLHGDFVLPDNVPANEFLNIEGKKLSTSRGWAVWLHEFLEEFPADYLRYSLLGVLPETKDSDFSWKDFQSRVNNELADTFGNFVNRSLTFAKRFFDGKVPELVAPNELDKGMLQAIAEAPAAIAEHLENYRFRDAGDAMMGIARHANKYFNDSEPWATRKSDAQKCANTIHVSLQVSAALSIVCEPFLPFTAAAMREMLALDGVRSSTRSEGAGGLGWHDAARPLMTSGSPLGEPVILFQKVEDERVQAQIDKLEAAAAPPEPRGGPYEPLSDTIVYDDFAKLDLRVALVTEAERVPKSKKLLRCQVDLGFEKRQVLAGVAEHLSPEDLIGKKVVMVANLAPRKMMGLESQGMLLMATEREGRLLPVWTEGEPGSTVA